MGEAGLFEMVAQMEASPSAVAKSTYSCVNWLPSTRTIESYNNRLLCMQHIAVFWCCPMKLTKTNNGVIDNDWVILFGKIVFQAQFTVVKDMTCTNCRIIGTVCINRAKKKHKFCLSVKQLVIVLFTPDVM